MCPDLRTDLLLAFLVHFDGGAVEDRIFGLASLGLQHSQELPAWLGEFMTSSSQGWDSFTYKHAIRWLSRYSLVQRVYTIL